MELRYFLNSPAYWDELEEKFRFVAGDVHVCYGKVFGSQVLLAIRTSMRKALDSDIYFEKCIVMKALFSMALANSSKIELSSYSYFMKVRR